MQTLYLRAEQTNDAKLIDYMARCVNPKRPLTDHKDLVAYRDKQASREVARWPWYYQSKPVRGQHLVTLNRTTFGLAWL